MPEGWEWILVTMVSLNTIINATSFYYGIKKYVRKRKRSRT